MIHINLFKPKATIVPVGEVIRYPETVRHFGFRDLGGDWDRNRDGTIHIYLASLGYADNEEQADCGVLRLRILCEKCQEKTDYFGQKLFCHWGRILMSTYLYKCRICDHLTEVKSELEPLFEKGFWD